MSNQNIILFGQSSADGKGFSKTFFVRVNNGKLEVTTSDDLVKFYSIETNEDGTISKVNPAEIILPLPNAWIESVLQRAKTDNIAQAVEWLNEQIATGKLDSEITFKGLRIPNQQLSSNDIVKVKKFHVPSNKNYVIVPSELVVKVGADS